MIAYSQLSSAYGGLGAMANFSDRLISWCYDRQILVDPDQRPIYFECLREVADARNSESLGIKAVTLASEGEVTHQELEHAYFTLGMNPIQARNLDDEHLLSSYHAQLFNAGPQHKLQLRSSLKIVASHRQSNLLRNAAEERKILEFVNYQLADSAQSQPWIRPLSGSACQGTRIITQSGPTRLRE